MSGIITTKHLFMHANIIIYEFGLKVYLRCLTRCAFRSGPVTFLDCVY